MPRSAVCKITGASFEIEDTELETLSHIGECNPILGGVSLPIPNVHPSEALRQMYVFGALRWLFKDKSALSGAPLLTRYNPVDGYKVCTQDEFYDGVDNRAVGQEYDFSRPFFEQWNDLLRSVILPPLSKTNCEDSEYVNGAQNVKSCYLCFAVWDCRDCMYCLSISRCNDCLDLVFSRECQFCYSSVSLIRCYEVHNSKDCKDCTECFGCYDCQSCTKCYGCVGLFHQEHCIFNEKVSKEKYEAFISEKHLGNFTSRLCAESECGVFWSSTNHTVNTLINCTDCSGAYLDRCENCVQCWEASGCKDCSNLIAGIDSDHCSRGFARRSEYTFFTHGLDCQNSAYCYTLFGGSNILYSAYMYGGCMDCFGCIALNKQQYCILNKQYTKSEYEDLAPRVIAHMKSTGEWGEWFPVKFAPHLYHESSIHEFMADIPESVARARGYRVGEEVENVYPSKFLQGKLIPEQVDSTVVDLLITTPIRCAITGKHFNIQKREIEFCMRHKLPVPRVHWRERMRQKFTQRSQVPAV